MDNRKIDGWFITFTDEERALIEATLEDEGYDVGPAGLKKFVLDTITQPPLPEPKSKQFGQYVRDHPEEVLGAAQFTLGAIQSVIGKIKIKKAGK